ncbi:DNA/RNA polymerase [Schizophyllum commune H4-8]|uniref:DNA/RNA polymerase n=1 Tax=Schizophyllum commune (strain H4-8 / FGSC 9210) TaxID=578458 RepID=UPI00215FD616|nr:DNA/RNA polymerase [Schizophyllum commune H4-8]KAI5885661.1 DNA/RNA polymerase [Schizophyllum commune H4-8]
MDSWIQLGVIEPSKSPWAAPVFITYRNVSSPASRRYLASVARLSMAHEKLAFRCHRGLWQFKRMPFGYRNGPSVFQRVMQGILAPFLTSRTTSSISTKSSRLLLLQKVSRLGLSTHKEKVDAILDLEEPRNPFFNLLKKDTPWSWTEVHREAFDLCKQVLTNAPVSFNKSSRSSFGIYEVQRLTINFYARTRASSLFLAW